LCPTTRPSGDSLLCPQQLDRVGVVKLDVRERDAQLPDRAPVPFGLDQLRCADTP
jgi:hypothetical protein